MNHLIEAEGKMEIIQRKGELYRAVRLQDKKCAKMGAQSK